MAAVDGAGFNLDEDIGAKISGFRKEYDNDRDGREDYGKRSGFEELHNLGRPFSFIYSLDHISINF